MITSCYEMGDVNETRMNIIQQGFCQGPVISFSVRVHFLLKIRIGGITPSYFSLETARQLSCAYREQYRRRVVPKNLKWISVQSASLAHLVTLRDFLEDDHATKCQQYNVTINQYHAIRRFMYSINDRGKRQSVSEFLHPCIALHLHSHSHSNEWRIRARKIVNDKGKRYINLSNRDNIYDQIKTR